MLLSGTKVLHKLHEANVLLEPEAKSKDDMRPKVETVWHCKQKMTS